MTTESNDPAVLHHILATGQLLDAAIEAFRAQCGADGHRMVLGALKAGAMLKASTTLSLAGAMGITFELIAPNGEVINLGQVEFSGDGPPN